MMGAIYIPYDMVTPTQSTSPTSSLSVVDSPNHVAEITSGHSPGWEVEPYQPKAPSSRLASDRRGRRDPYLSAFGNFSSKQSELPHYGSHINVIPPPPKRRKQLPEARYGCAKTNILIRMQNTPIPTGEPVDPYLPAVPYQLVQPDDFLFDRDDNRYLRLFLERGPVMVKPLGLFFPCACERMFKTSMEYTRLRHAIVAITMYYAESTVPRYGSIARLNRYLESFSPKSEECKALVKKNGPVGQEGEIYALFLVLTLTLMRLAETKDIKSLRRHVKRLYKLFQTAQADASKGLREPLSPLLFWIWRQVMRINVTFALGVTHSHALFPPPARHPNGLPAQGHGPIRPLIGSAASSEFEEWTLAQLELDDLGNRIFRMHLRASQIRNGEDPERDLHERELLLNTQFLARENEKWKQKPVIQVAEYKELLYRQQAFEDLPPDKTFLQYPMIRFKNPLYACLLLTHYAMTISLSLILDPQVGPRSTDRVEAAVEICRIYAALGGNHPVGSLTCLASVWWAGLTFDSRTYPQEARWVRASLADPVHCGQGMRYLTHLKVVWKKAHRSWDVWTKFPKEEDGD